MATFASTSTGLLDLLRTLAREGSQYLRDLRDLVALEWREDTRSLRTMAVLAVVGVLVLGFSFLFLSLALVGVISYWLQSWRWALLIVGAAYALTGVLMLAAIVTRLRQGLLRFERSRHRLREDAEYWKRKLAA